MGTAMYPASIVNNSYYPVHLGKELLNIYTKQYFKRIELKPLAKKDKRIKGVVDGLKLQLNVPFGKFGSMDSWLYDLQCLYSVTLTGQFALLMLIEELELNGLSVIIANTDGIETLVPKNKKDSFKKICQEWEQKTNYVLEGDQYEWIYMSTVNDYIAKTVSEHIKKKGDIISEFELYKNKSSRIVPLAIGEYFSKGTNPIEFIQKHDNIFDFCIMARATGNLYIELQKIVRAVKPVIDKDELLSLGWIQSNNSWKKDEWTGVDCISFEEALNFATTDKQSESGNIEVKKLKKLVRYYLSSKSEWQMFKRGIGSTGKKANVSTHAENEMGKIYVQYFNKYEKKEMDDYNVDKNQYIYRTLKFIDKIEKTDKAKRFLNSTRNVQQISMF